MRAIYVFTLSFALSGCVSFTTSGTKEAVFFSGKQAPADKVQVLKPYNDVPLSMEFACPKKIATLSTSYVIPLPPVLPVGFANEKVSYLRVRMPVGTESAIAHTRIVTRDGTAIPLSDARQSQRTVNGEAAVETIYAVDKDCETLDDGVLQVAGLSYRNKNYPASETRLRFDSTVTGSIGWWPPALFNGGHAVSKSGIDEAR